MEKAISEKRATQTYRVMIRQVIHFWGVVTVEAEDYDAAVDLAFDTFMPDWDNSCITDAWHEKVTDEEAK